MRRLGGHRGRLLQQQKQRAEHGIEQGQDQASRRPGDARSGRSGFIVISAACPLHCGIMLIPLRVRDNIGSAPIVARHLCDPVHKDSRLIKFERVLRY